jgi:hypothetical protein
MQRRLTMRGHNLKLLLHNELIGVRNRSRTYLAYAIFDKRILSFFMAVSMSSDSIPP